MEDGHEGQDREVREGPRSRIRGPGQVGGASKAVWRTGADGPEKAAVDFVRRCRERGLHPSIMSMAKLYRIPRNEMGHSLSSRSMEAFA
jgi:hypothetical protein